MPNIDEYTRALITFVVEQLAELQLEECEAAMNAVDVLTEDASPRTVMLTRDAAIKRLWHRRKGTSGAIAEMLMAVADPNFPAGPTPRTTALWELQQRLKAINAAATAAVKLWVMHPDGMQDDLAIAAEVITIGTDPTCHIVVAAAMTPLQVTLSRRDDGNVWAMNMNAAGTGVWLQARDRGAAVRVASAVPLQPGDTLLVGVTGTGGRDGKRKATRIKRLP